MYEAESLFNLRSAPDAALGNEELWLTPGEYREEGIFPPGAVMRAGGNVETQNLLLKHLSRFLAS